MIKDYKRELINALTSRIPTTPNAGWKLMSKYYCECLINREYNFMAEIDYFDYTDENEKGFSVQVLNSLGETIEFSSKKGLKVHSLLGDASLPFPSIILGKEFDWNSCWSFLCHILNDYFPKRYDL